MVKNSKDHLTVDDVFEILKEDGRYVSKATVYRCVGNLLKEGSIRQYKINSGGKACYQYVNKEQGCDSHCHLVCLRCEKVCHFECDEMLSLRRTLQEKKGFLLDIPGSSLYGFCSSCKNKV